MAIDRLFARTILAAAFLLAAAVSLSVIVFRGPDKPETWTVVAASLAVLTSVISTWSSRRILELQEDAQKPNPVPAFDMMSKYGSVLFKVKNSGAAAAYNIALTWNVDLLGHDDSRKGFIAESGRPGIGHLLPGESISQMIDVHHGFIARLPESDYSGEITFEDASGRKFRRPFRLSGRQYDGTPSYDAEVVKTQYELQKIPTELREIRHLIETRLNNGRGS
jgi:hypothetical protein